QAAAGRVVLAMRLEVLGQALDVLGQQRDLDFRGAGVALLGRELLDELGLAFCGDGHGASFLPGNSSGLARVQGKRSPETGCAARLARGCRLAQAERRWPSGSGSARRGPDRESGPRA